MTHDLNLLSRAVKIYKTRKMPIKRMGRKGKKTEKKARSFVSRPWVPEGLIIMSMIGALGYKLNAASPKVETEIGKEIYEKVSVIKRYVPGTCERGDCVPQRYNVSLNGEISFELDDADLFYRLNTKNAIVSYRPITTFYYDKGCISKEKKEKCVVRKDIENRLINAASI